MFFDVWMIGRSLEGDIERDLDSVSRRERDDLLEVIDRAEVGMNRFVSAERTANRPRRSDVPLLSANLIVLSFTKRRADRMNRRKVENLESHLRNARQLLLEIAQR